MTKLPMQELDFTPVNSPNAKDTKDGSAFESQNELEIFITALDWMLMR